MGGGLVVAGAGMAGLVTAVRAVELGLRPVVYEKSPAPGGSMLLSSGVAWRHREWSDFERECPGGDAVLQRLVWERLDEGLAWLRGLGAPVVWEGTRNDLTTGVRLDPAGLTAALVRRLPGASLRLAECAPLETGDPTILATGGFAASVELVARHIGPAAPLRRRGNASSTGDGLTAAVARGASLSAGMDEFYGRNMPDAPWGEAEYVALAQLYGRVARIFDATGVEFFRGEDVSWSEANVAQATAQRPGARAFYILDDDALAASVSGKRVADIVSAAPPVALVSPGALPFEPPPGTRVAVRVAASITHTLGGVRIDGRARVLDVAGDPVAGLYAAGVDAGGVATGGYASGLAQALVLGLVAAESAAAG